MLYNNKFINVIFNKINSIYFNNTIIYNISDIY